ncbi:IncP plasmid survival protein KfrC family protein [Xanthomonas translucens]|uniref:IncP plasmid survival protein KfrC family protein n=1 Tax=Xanthomonas campestris pv. translucens TaxID=343 RepID=UPI00071E6EB9|nr:IncP plasmid survival protein KfrC family protein [Xanthomonas translucens]QSQ62215.1 conjugal transfer protein [Xanthomonas translucens pv. undulosa]UKE41845.1 conjugal transfer protein [Xanthomonas translucens pv. undulosa]UPU47154.1 conjugal transfer protein [Xanthomonas translucens pv. undulosa]UPU47190.1 conjugal transfer protein [Xanthomonas translucens pv. undulosa]
MRHLTPNAGWADSRRVQPATAAGSATSTTSRAAATGDGLLAAAEAADTEQQAALEAAPLDQTYQEALALYVQAKHDQVERVEDRLENLIERQQARLQQTQANQPGLLTRPGAKRAWQNQQMQQQARLQSLHVRLEAVREIKEGMGLHSPKVEELATRKMRAENPELASDWDAMREAARRHQALLRREEQEKKQAQTLERPGRSQSLGLTRAV